LQGDQGIEGVMWLEISQHCHVQQTTTSDKMRPPVHCTDSTVNNRIWCCQRRPVQSKALAHSDSPLCTAAVGVAGEWIWKLKHNTRLGAFPACTCPANHVRACEGGFAEPAVASTPLSMRSGYGHGDPWAAKQQKKVEWLWDERTVSIWIRTEVVVSNLLLCWRHAALP
jgi:hypothetical protein